MSEWDSRPVDQLLSLVLDFRGRTPKKLGMEWGGGEIPALSANNVEMGGINFSKECYLGSNELYSKWMTKGDCKRGDVLMTTEAPLGNVASIPDERRYILSQRTILLRTDDNQLSNDYLRQYISSEAFQLMMRQQSSGTTATGIQRSKFEKLIIKFPRNLSEQAKIADVLSTVDRAIDQTEALIAKQQRIKTGLMQDLLTRGIDEHGNLRSEETHAFKDSPLGRIPVEWECCNLGKRLNGIEQGWSPDCDGNPASAGEWGVLKTTAVVWTGYEEAANKALPEHLKPRPHYEVNSGDILMTRGGPNSRVGVVVYVEKTRSKLMLSDKLYRLIPDASIEPEFLVMNLSSEQTQRHLSTLKTGLAESQTNISQEIVKQLLVTLPPRTEQELISSTVRRTTANYERSVESLSKLRSLKTALMQDLLTGKNRVTPLLDKEVVG